MFFGGRRLPHPQPKGGTGIEYLGNGYLEPRLEAGPRPNRKGPEGATTTYSSERADIAKQLIDFDREWSKMFSSKPRTEDNPDGVDPPSSKNISSCSPDSRPG